MLTRQNIELQTPYQGYNLCFTIVPPKTQANLNFAARLRPLLPDIIFTLPDLRQRGGARKTRILKAMPGPSKIILSPSSQEIVEV